MRYENTVQWAINTQLGDVYRVCANAETIDELVDNVREPLGNWLDIDATSIAFADDPAVILGAIGHVTDAFLDKIRRHAVRCIEGKGKGIRDPEDIVIQHAGVPPCQDIIDPDGILWTGAIENEGRLIAVLTFYRQASQQISPLEMTALRQIRNLISEAIHRIQLTAQDFVTSATQLVDDTVESDVVIVDIMDADLIGKAFGQQRVRNIQEELIESLTMTFPRAFMIARIGQTQVIIIAHPGDGHCLSAWTTLITEACTHVTVNSDSPVKISVELGEVQAIGDGASDTTDHEKTTRQHGDVESPTNVEIGVLAG